MFLRSKIWAFLKIVKSVIKMLKKVKNCIPIPLKNDSIFKTNVNMKTLLQINK